MKLNRIPKPLGFWTVFQMKSGIPWSNIKTKPELPPFTNPNKERSFCSKCGWDFAKIKYCPGTFPNGEICGLLADAYSYNTDAPEHLHRTCERCGYVWLEKILEKIKDATESPILIMTLI